MKVFDEIRAATQESITKEDAVLIVEDLFKRAIKQHAKETFDAILKKAKQAASTSNYKIENGKKIIEGQISLGDWNNDTNTCTQELRIYLSTKEEIVAGNMFDLHIDLFQNAYGFKDIPWHRTGSSKYINASFSEKRLRFDIQYINYSTIVRPGFLFSKKYFSFYLTDSGKIFYDEFMNYAKEEKNCFELIAMTQYRGFLDDDQIYSGYTIDIPSEQPVQTSKFRPQDCYYLHPFIKYKIVC